MLYLQKSQDIGQETSGLINRLMKIRNHKTKLMKTIEDRIPELQNNYKIKA